MIGPLSLAYYQNNAKMNAIKYVGSFMENIIVALDVNTEKEAMAIVDKLGSDILWYKVGLQLYLSAGKTLIEKLKAKGKKVFLDLKFFDIPNTVEKAVINAAGMGADMLTLHALGGREMISRAAVAGERVNPSLVILAVTILTSTDEDIMQSEMGLSGSVENNVSRLAKLAVEVGAAGVVCSPHEIQTVRADVGAEVCIVSPGVRMPSGDTHDQKRVKTPWHAMEDGANFLVIGRALTKADDPGAVLAEIKSNADKISRPLNEPLKREVIFEKRDYDMLKREADKQGLQSPDAFIRDIISKSLKETL